MLIIEKKTFLVGALMALTFLIVLILMFLPLRGGLNTFEASDRLFNSIAKGSSNQFEALRREVDGYRGSTFEVKITLNNDDLAVKARTLLDRAGVKTEENGLQLKATGDLSQLAGAIIEDAEAVFHNRGTEIVSKYGYADRQTLFAWWNILKEMQRVLESKGRFDTAAMLHDVTMKGVEVAYNFYGIEPKNASSNTSILAGALLFYVLYTLWWGYAVLYLFNGLGMKMKASSKKEV